MSLFRMLRGQYRAWLGLCPSCKFDRDKIDDCYVCDIAFMTHEQFSRQMWRRFEERGFK